MARDVVIYFGAPAGVAVGCLTAIGLWWRHTRRQARSDELEREVRDRQQ